MAFGAANMITLCTLRDVECIFTILKPTEICSPKSLCYLDWGFGLTPSHRERTVSLLAFAWDRLIQLIYISEDGSQVEIDGFYFSEMEVISLHFVGDSILMAVFEGSTGKEVKLLYTTKFYPGPFN